MTVEDSERKEKIKELTKDRKSREEKRRNKAII